MRRGLTLVAAIALIAAAHSQPVVVAPDVDGGLALLEYHLTENAPDTLFALKLRKIFYTNVRNNAAAQIHLDSLFTDRIVLLVTQIVHDPTPRTINNRITMRILDSRFVDYHQDNVRLYIDCINITKTQARFRLYKLWLPLIQDSVVLVPPAQRNFEAQRAATQVHEMTAAQRLR